MRFKFLFFIFLFINPSLIFSQADSLSIPGTNTFNKDSLFDSNNRPVIINEILLIGNKTTKPHIITRELVFHKGDTIPRNVLAEAMRRSRENLLNASLFNFVDIYDQVDSHDSAKTNVIVRLAERWYIWPLPIFEIVDRNFNEWWLTKDFSRTNYGAYVTKENFRGRKEKLSVLVRLGYSQRLGLYYTVPYIDRKQQNGLAFGVTYTRNHEIAYGLSDSKLEYFKDPNEYVRKQTSAAIRFTHRHDIHDYHSIGAEWQDNLIADTILNYNPDYFLKSTNTQQLLILSYQYKTDYRDFKVYPLEGYYFDFEINKLGIGTFKNEPDLLALTANFRNYSRLAPNWHFAAGAKGKLSGKSFAPYYNQRGLGYGNDFVRGYEYYVIGGQDYFLLKSTLKYTLIGERVVKIGFLPMEKFNRIPFAVYLNLFSDFAYVRDRQFAEDNPLGNSFLIGSGIGLDYVTYYDLVFRVEYSINKMGERGFFLHFTAPIF